MCDRPVEISRGTRLHDHPPPLWAFAEVVEIPAPAEIEPDPRKYRLKRDSGVVREF
jgi:hypothetical protein